MSNIQYLTDANFSLKDGRMICNTGAPISFVLFRVTVCKNSDAILSIFMKMAQYEKRVKFAVVDVGKFRSVIEMSKSTNLPIKNSPTMVLYVNGVAHINYKKERTQEKFQFFLDQMLPTIQTKNTFVPKQQKPQQHPTGLNPSRQHDTTGIYMPEMNRDMGAVVHMDDEKILIPTRVTPYNEPWGKKG